MTFSLTSFGVHRLVKEMQSLVGGFLEKAYHPDYTTVMLRFNAPSVAEDRNYEKIDLMIQMGSYVALGRFDVEMPKNPSTFAMTLRKHLANARVKGVSQVGFERILVMELETKQGLFKLVIELFANGNLILVKDDTIVQPLSSKSWKHRVVKAKQPFQFPPPRGDPREMDMEGFKQFIYSSEKDIVRTLVSSVNLPPKFAEEVCFRSGLEKNSSAHELTPEDCEKLFTTIQGILLELEEGKGGFVYTDDEGGLELSPIPIQMFKGREVKEYITYSMVVQELQGIEREEVEESFEDPEVKRIRRRLRTQEDSVEGFKVTEVTNRAKGEAIYSNFKLCEQVLMSLLTAKEEVGWEEVEKRASGIEAIKQLNTKDGYVIVPLKHEDETLAVKLDLKLDVNQNATLYYEKAKKAHEKIKGAKTAIAETKRKLVKAEKEGVKKQKSAKRAETKKYWFDRFRWFISSTGSLVLGGRDATTNDRVVKKHMSTGDRYAHADLHGAPSIVIKKEGDEPVSEETLIEACYFALIYSKAWNANIGSGTAYWVTADQVSKTPESGEYLPKGAFIVRGKRNIVNDIPLVCGVGEIDYQGNTKIMGGPLAAIEKRCKRYCVLVPGQTKVSDVANELAKDFDVVVDDILRHMPPGKVDIKERFGY